MDDVRVPPVVRKSRGVGSWRRLMATVFGLVVLGYVVWCALLFVMQDAMMFPRHLVMSPMSDGPVSPSWEQWWRETPDGGRTEAWFLIGRGVSAESPGPLLVFFHGNGELIDHRAVQMGMYSQRGISVLMVEYRGYGRSTGRPSQRGIVEDAHAFLERALERAEFDGERLVYHGISLGSAVASALSEKHPARALIMESPFKSTAAMARRYLAPSFLVRNPFRTDRTLRKFEGPVLLFHAEGDTIIPVTHSRALAEIGRDVTLRTAEGNHNDFPRDWNWYDEEIVAFLQRAGILRDDEGGS